eukprot:scaffold12200_cov122-Cylindrotheca_fusiformis.AAC.5
MYVYNGQDEKDIPQNVKHVLVDSSVKEIPDKTFKAREFMASIQLPEGIQRIGMEAFLGCRSLKVISLPSSCIEIRRQAFAFCYDLTSVEVTEGLVAIGDGAFHYCVSLVNIALPTTLTETNDSAFAFCAKLHQQFSEEADMFHALAHRFDGLPIHKLCYEQPFRPADDTIENLYKVTGDAVDGQCGFDCFGMTPLHILALSGKPKLDLFSALLQRQPETLMTKDGLGKLPIHYVCLSNAPFDVFKLALDTQKSAFPQQPPDWKTLVWITEREESYKYVVKSSIENRVSHLGLAAWRSDMLNTVAGALVRHQRNARLIHLRLVHSKLARYERLEVVSLLELALWKAKLDQVEAAIEKKAQEAPGMSNVDSSIDRQGCRISSGDEVVVSNVLPFLDE